MRAHARCLPKFISSPKLTIEVAPDPSGVIKLMRNISFWLAPLCVAIGALSGCGGDEGKSGNSGSTAAPVGPASSASPASATEPVSPVTAPKPASSTTPATSANGPATAPAVLADQPYTDSVAYSGAQGDSVPSSQAAEAAAVTHHQITLSGNTIRYTATAGHLIAADPTTGKKATIFYTAYTLDGAAPGSRPVTFTYNGGPGASSIFLHMGAWAPVRLVTTDPAVADPDTLPTSYPMVDNAESLIDTTDIVYVDPPGTGFSEAVAPAINGDFWGVEQDGRILDGFIQRYLAVNQRQSSPLYLYGESYGTPRTDVLVNMLEEDGVNVTGITLQSALLDYNLLYSISADAQYLPSYAAVGTFFGLVPQTPSLAAYLASVQAYASQTYAPFLVANPYASASAPIAAQLATYTGVPANTWENDSGQLDFAADFVPGQVIGRYDGRVKVPASSPWVTQDSAGDPSDTLTSPFGPQGQAYLSSTLKYTNSKSTYIQLSNVIIGDWDWTHGSDGGNFFEFDSIPDLQSALLLNPRLKVLALNGYHDLATPFFNTEISLARLGEQPNLYMTFYDGGHMIYLNQSSRAPMKTDIVNFYRATGVATSVAEPASAASVVAAPVASF